MSVDKERRSGGQRIPIKTLVEIGAGEGGSAAFEAESVDITTAGMHLKTAYLPEVGEPLVCRFEGNGKEIVVHGEVVWRNEDAYGGDFGVRFLELDQESIEALREVLGEVVEPSQAAAGGDAPRAARNTRVRLHIDGLGAPMKARVREVTRSEVLVGSNLEFLKVGRSVDLENIDCAESRPARIERVNIEIDPASHIPQLMVALRYLDAAASVQEDPCAPQAASPRARREDDEDDDVRAEQGDAEDELQEQAQGRSAMLWSRVKQMGPKLAALGGKAKDLGGRAKDVVARAIDRARAKGRADADLPLRRTTAPPPNGGLRGEGRRLTRESLEEALEEIPPQKRKLAKRAAVIGVAVLMIAVVAVALNRKPKTAATAAVDPTAESADSAGLVVPDDLGGTAVAVASNGGAMVANVPLFGPTPMETAPAPAPAPNPAVAAGGPAAFPAAVAVPPPGDAKPAADDETADQGDDDDGSDTGAVAAAVTAHDDAADEGEDDSADDSKPAARPSRQHASKPASGKASAGSFSHGKVRNPTVLSLRMNQSIKSIRGNGNASGFTVEVSGARSQEAAAGLARQDRRIASARVTNKGNSADLVVRFREPVPGYRVVAQGNNLRIMLGNEKKTASNAKPATRNHKPAAKKNPAEKSTGKH